MAGWLGRLFHRKKDEPLRCTAVVAAAGSSARMEGQDKLLLILGEQPVLVHTLRALELCPYITEIVIVTREDRIVPVGQLCRDYAFSKVSKVIVGGDTRTASVLAGVREAEEGASLIAVHDGARPLVSQSVLEQVILRARECGAEIVPVDSEHSAIFQCLTGRAGELHKILLTGSGGPFRGWTREQTRDVTPEMAVSHPNWSMGAKISVDSATMMNKGLEFIEAMHLFGVTPDDIQVLIHPESVVHSMVELLDGTVIAQLGVPDMGLPIQYALTYPERKPSRSDRLDLTAYPNGLHFYEPDLEALPCLALAMRCARTGGTAPTVMNAANEIAVGLFLGHKIGYHSIYESVAAAVEAIAPVAAPDLDVIRAADQEARAFVRSYFRF